MRLHRWQFPRTSGSMAPWLQRWRLCRNPTCSRLFSCLPRIGELEQNPSKFIKHGNLGLDIYFSWRPSFCLIGFMLVSFFLRWCQLHKDCNSVNSAAYSPFIQMENPKRSRWQKVDNSSNSNNQSIKRWRPCDYVFGLKDTASNFVPFRPCSHHPPPFLFSTQNTGDGINTLKASIQFLCKHRTTAWTFHCEASFFLFPTLAICSAGYFQTCSTRTGHSTKWFVILIVPHGGFNTPLVAGTNT